MPKRSGGGLAEGAPILAHDDACSTAVLPAPARDILRAMASGGGNQAGIRSVFAIRADIDKNWCAGQTY
jgi:hypothetical protein